MLYIIDYIVDMVNSIWFLDQTIVLESQFQKKAFLFFKKNHDSKSTSVYLVDRWYQWPKNDITQV
jgi:hypothetical protein